MPGYVALPAYRAPSAINFDPLNEGLDDLGKQLEKNRLLRQAQAVGAALAPDTATPATANPLMAQPSVPASPAQASAAAAGRDFSSPTSGTDYSPPIKQIESGGNYKAIGPITASGDRAYGAHQVMGKNIPSWTQEVLGQSLTPQQYLDNPDAQEKVFKAKFGQFVAKTGNPQDAASMWFTGKPLAQGANRRDILGTTGTQYVNNFNANLGGAPATAAPSQAAPAPPGPNYRAAAAKAFEYGNIALGTQLLQQQTELDNQAYTRGRQARQDVREEQTFNETHQKAVAARVGILANSIAQEPDPARRTSMWTSLVAMDPEIAQGLRQNGIDPNDVATGTRFMINQARGITEKLGKDRYVVVGKRLYDTTTQQFISPPDGAPDGEEKFNKNLSWGIDENTGEPVALQASDQANIVASKLPKGVKIAGKDPVRIDAGDKWILLDPVTRNTIGEISKNVAAEAQQKEIGKSAAERQFNKPQAQLTAETAISNLDRVKQEITTLKGMPALSSATGNLQSRLPNVWQSTADADSSIRNLKGKLATTALQAMRDASKTGGAVGSVTEREWPILESMIGNLDPSQGDATFVQRLGEIENYLEGAKARISGAYQQTYGEPPTSQGGNQSAAPVQGAAPRATNKATGQVLELNPQTNQWEAVR